MKMGWEIILSKCVSTLGVFKEKMVNVWLFRKTSLVVRLVALQIDVISCGMLFQCAKQKSMGFFSSHLMNEINYRKLLRKTYSINLCFVVWKRVNWSVGGSEFKYLHKNFTPYLFVSAVVHSPCLHDASHRAHRTAYSYGIRVCISTRTHEDKFY